jgi:ABC-2 type transport system permease protein
MKKIWLIIQREFLFRVKKRTFILMSFMGPLLIVLLFSLIQWASGIEDKQVKKIVVVDESTLFEGLIPESKLIKFEYTKKPLEKLRENFHQYDYYAILYIPGNVVYQPKIQLFSDNQTSYSVESYIKNNVETILQDLKLFKLNVPAELIKRAKSGIFVQTVLFDKQGNIKEHNRQNAMMVSLLMGMGMYFFIFLFGVQVMRGTMEEKGNRILELIVSSIEPFKLMMGKIIGIGLTGILQFAITVGLTIALLYGAMAVFFPDLMHTPTEQVISQDIFSQQSAPTAAEQVQNAPAGIKDIFSFLKGLNFAVIFLSFAMYFVLGYFLYAALFAAIGAAIDQDSDTQQFILPVTIPLLFGMFVLIVSLTNPAHPLNRICSLFPLTSPVVMMGRIPFGVPVWELGLSIFFLIITFLATSWIAGKIYKTGLLIYGQKINYKTLWKWLNNK